MWTLFLPDIWVWYTLMYREEVCWNWSIQTNGWSTVSRMRASSKQSHLVLDSLRSCIGNREHSNCDGKWAIVWLSGLFPNLWIMLLQSSPICGNVDSAATMETYVRSTASRCGTYRGIVQVFAPHYELWFIWIFVMEMAGYNINTLCSMSKYPDSSFTLQGLSWRHFGRLKKIGIIKII